MIQLILILLAGIIILLLIIAAFMPKNYQIKSEVIINRPKDEVFEYVKQIKNQEKYSKWVMADPNIEIEYTGIDGTVGFISSWKSNDKNVGIGAQEIMRIEDGVSYEVEIRFKKPFEGISKAITTTELVNGNETKVCTTFYTKSPFPMSIMVPFIKKMLKKDMDQNANRLKMNLEV